MATLWKKALWLDVESHETSLNQSLECIIPEYNNDYTLDATSLVISSDQSIVFIISLVKPNLVKLILSPTATVSFKVVELTINLDEEFGWSQHVLQLVLKP